MTSPASAAPRELVRATDIVGLPLVAITAGEALADIKDVLYAPTHGGLIGFTLNNRGRFAGPMKEPLPLASVFAIGPAAVMVPDSGVLAAAGSLRAEAKQDAQRNVLGNQVMTDAGSQIGYVVDLIVAIGVVAGTVPGPEAAARDGGTPAWEPGDVVGYEVSAEAGKREDPPRFLPLPYALAVSGEFLMVPAGVEAFIRDELTALGSAVHAFRETLRQADAAADAPEAPDPAGTPSTTIPMSKDGAP